MKAFFLPKKSKQSLLAKWRDLLYRFWICNFKNPPLRAFWENVANGTTGKYIWFMRIFRCIFGIFAYIRFIRILLNELNIRFFLFLLNTFKNKKKFWLYVVNEDRCDLKKVGAVAGLLIGRGGTWKSQQFMLSPEKNEKLINHNVYYSCSFWRRGGHPSLHYRWDKQEQVLLLFQGNIIANLCLLFL